VSLFKNHMKLNETTKGHWNKLLTEELHLLWNLHLRDVQKPTRYCLEQSTVANPVLSRGLGLDDLHTCLPASVIL